MPSPTSRLISAPTAITAPSRLRPRTTRTSKCAAGTATTPPPTEPMAGYSGTPLPQKLGIKPGLRVRLVNTPAEVKAELQEALDRCRFVKSGELDFVMVFAKSQAGLRKEVSRLAKRLATTGMLWTSWPKKTSGMASDM